MRRLIFFVLLVVLVSHSYTQNSTARFLYWQPSAKSMGLGGTGATDRENSFASYYNPAILGFCNTFSFSLSHTNPHSSFEGTSHNYITASYNFREIGTFGLSANLISVDQQLFINESAENFGFIGSKNGFLNPTHYQLKLSYANRLNSNIAIGLSLNYLKINLAEYKNLNLLPLNQDAFLFDFGILATDLIPQLTWQNTSEIENALINNSVSGGLSAGISFLNIGGKISFIDEQIKADPPSFMLLGFSYTPLITDIISSKFSVDYEAKLYDDDLDIWHLGNEFLIYKFFAVRIGSSLPTDSKQNKYFTYGFGLRSKYFNVNVSKYKRFLISSWHLDMNFSLGAIYE